MVFDHNGLHSFTDLTYGCVYNVPPYSILKGAGEKKYLKYSAYERYPAYRSV